MRAMRLIAAVAIVAVAGPAIAGPEPSELVRRARELPEDLKTGIVDVYSDMTPEERDSLEAAVRRGDHAAIRAFVDSVRAKKRTAGEPSNEDQDEETDEGESDRDVLFVVAAIVAGALGLGALVAMIASAVRIRSERRLGTRSDLFRPFRSRSAQRACLEGWRDRLRRQESRDARRESRR